MAGIPKEYQGRLKEHMDAIKTCFKKCHITVVVRFPWLEEKEMDGAAVFGDDPDLDAVIQAIDKRRIEKGLQKINRQAKRKKHASGNS